MSTLVAAEMTWNSALILTFSFFCAGKQWEFVSESLAPYLLKERKYHINGKIIAFIDQNHVTHAVECVEKT